MKKSYPAQGHGGRPCPAGNFGSGIHFIPLFLVVVGIPAKALLGIRKIGLRYRFKSWERIHDTWSAKRKKRFHVEHGERLPPTRFSKQEWRDLLKLKLL